MNAAELAQIKADIQAVIDDNPQAIAFKRGATTLAAQTVRVERAGSSAQTPGNEAGESGRGKLVILGAVGLNVQKDDTFVDASGMYCKVTLVRINKQVCVQAEAEVME